MSMENDVLIKTSIRHTEIIEFTVPTCLLCYLVNGDDEGLTDEEVEAVDIFLEHEDILVAGGPDEDAEPYFSWDNDITDEGGDVIDIKCVVRSV